MSLQTLYGVGSAAQTAAAVGGTTYGVVQGERAQRAGRYGRREQAAAQEQAEGAAMRAARIAAENEKKANARGPDVSALLAGQQGFGVSSMLSGPAGVALNRLRLGRGSALGA